MDCTPTRPLQNSHTRFTTAIFLQSLYHPERELRRPDNTSGLASSGFSLASIKLEALSCWPSKGVNDAVLAHTIVPCHSHRPTSPHLHRVCKNFLLQAMATSIAAINTVGECLERDEDEKRFDLPSPVIFPQTSRFLGKLIQKKFICKNSSTNQPCQHTINYFQQLTLVISKYRTWQNGKVSSLQRDARVCVGKLVGTGSVEVGQSALLP